MAPKAKSGSQRRRSQRIGRYTPPEQSGRYTRPIPAGARKSPAWFGIAILALLLGGVLVIILNYTSVLPGGASVWYLVAGLVLIFAGFLMATRYK
jgi:4-hydroxybenzoate polyprenyltransferase